MTREQIANHYPPVRRASLPAKNTTVSGDGEYEDVWPPPMPRSAIRYQGTITGQPPVIISGNRRYVLHEGPPPQKTAPPQKPPRQTQHHDPLHGHRIHWMVFVGMAMFTMLAGWVLLTMLANWWQVTQDDWHYGRPRTFQMDMVVGHSDSAGSPSHFIAINLNRHIEIIEFQGGDPSKAKVYVGPMLIGPGQELVGHATIE